MNVKLWTPEGSIPTEVRPGEALRCQEGHIWIMTEDGPAMVWDRKDAVTAANAGTGGYGLIYDPQPTRYVGRYEPFVRLIPEKT